MNNLHFLAPQNERVALALSGGADSMALLLMLRTHYPKLHALTVDHDLRPESAAEAAQVAHWCEGLNVPHSILRWQHEGITSRIQERARNARYGLMFEWCRANNIAHLFTAHHLDDQIETVIFRLLRGSGIEGMAGISPISMREGITLHRPLLAMEKSALIASLNAANHPWAEDPSNSKKIYTRNTLRHHLKSLTKDQKTRISHITESFSKFSNLLNLYLVESLNLCFVRESANGGVLSHSAFMAAPPELKTRMLHHICKEVSGNHSPIRSEKNIRLLADLETGKGKHMLHGVMFDYRPKIGAWKITLAKPAKPLAK